MNIRILTEKVTASSLQDFAKEWYPTFLKGCVDLENNKVAIGGEYHIESAQILVNEGGLGKNIWGFNIRYLDNENIIEFDSMVNIKPKINNGRIITDGNLQLGIRNLITEFISL